MITTILIALISIGAILLIRLYIKNSSKESLDKKPWLDDEVSESYYKEAEERIKRNARKIL